MNDEAAIPPEQVPPQPGNSLMLLAGLLISSGVLAAVFTLVVVYIGQKKIAQLAANACATMGSNSGSSWNSNGHSSTAAQSNLKAISPVSMYKEDSRSYSATTSNSTSPKRVMQAYFKELDDELTLNIGDQVLVENVYDDGWGVGLNLSTNLKGVFPLTCLEQEVTDKRVSKRISSSYYSGVQNRPITLQSGRTDY